MTSRRLTITGQSAPDVDFFARQKLLSWWSQEKISSARVLIAGAGAVGNETIKNLVLLGFSNLLICDFDLIEDSNLSRTVLFGPNDIGKPKAQAAAERARAMALTPSPQIDWLHGDMTSMLGLGVFADVDIVLGCLDNVEARRFINLCCKRVGTPWIDAGINGLSGHVSVFAPDPDAVCYECILSAHQIAMARARYACGTVKRRHHAEGSVPTVQVASSIVAGIMAQECLKVLCDTRPVFGKRIWYDGANADYDVNTLTPRTDCPAHVGLPPIMDVGATHKIKLDEFLSSIESQWLTEVQLDLGDALYAGFLTSGKCSLCDTMIDHYKPVHALYDTDLFCDNHSAAEKNGAGAPTEPTGKSTSFSLMQTEPRILAMSLEDIGIPNRHIIVARGASGAERALRLSTA